MPKASETVPPATSAEPVDYSVVIPAYNEADYLPDTLNSLCQAMDGSALRGETILCDNNSTDATADIAREHGARVVFEPVNQISRARNTGARQAAGRYLVFLDADTRLSALLLKEALDRLESGDFIGGGATVRLDTDLTAAAGLGSKLWNTLSVRLGLAAGAFLFCRADAFRQLGGFSESVYASEEIWLSRALSRLGRRSGRRFAVIEDPPVVSSGRKLDWYSTPRQLLLIVMLLLFPFMVRFRALCGFWYRRPD